MTMISLVLWFIAFIQSMVAFVWAFTSQGVENGDGIVLYWGLTTRLGIAVSASLVAACVAQSLVICSNNLSALL